MRTWLIAAAVVTALCGCAMQPKTVMMKTTFDGEAHRPFVGPGPNAVSGQAFLRQQGGGTVTCAGEQVLLLPNTVFFREMLDIARKGSEPEHVGARISQGEFKSILRQGQCDAQGNFAFASVPSGSYLLATQVQWVVGYNRQGGGLLKTVSVEPGDSNRFLLSDADRAR